MRHYDNESLKKSSSIVRSEGSLNLWQTSIGDFWMPKNENVDTIEEMAEIIQGNTYLYHGRTVRKDDVVIDCGAHLGSFIRKSLQLGASLVIGVEPSSMKVEAMRRTFAVEIAAGKVRILQVAVWDKDDKLWLAGDPNMANSLIDQSEDGKKKGGEWVRVTTLDKIFVEEKQNRIDFLKMDIEGAETNALKGATAIIERYHPFLAIAVEHTDDLAQNARNVLGVVAGFKVSYKHGFGRYGKLNRWAAYTPWEIFFFTDSLSSALLKEAERYPDTTNNQHEK